jgi:hypothetical protein
MAGLTTQAQNNLLNLMKNVAWPASGAWGVQLATTWVGLFTTAPTTDASASFTGTEVTGGSYARVSVASSVWSAITGGSTAPSQISNSSIITFVTPTASWGTVLAIGIFDAVTAGNLLWWNPITSQAIGTGVVASFAASALVMTMD